MGDLVCQACGYSATFADAYIADTERSCDGEKHDWVKPMHPDVDIVTG